MSDIEEYYIGEGDRQLLLLSLALLSRLRPGFEPACRKSAILLNGEQLYQALQKYNSDVQPQPGLRGMFHP